VSGEYFLLLERRALTALKWAKRALEDGDYDVAAREAEYAAHLYIKALIYRVLREEVRGHNLRELLGVLISGLLEEDLEEEARMLSEFSRKKRRELAEISDAHVRAVYGMIEYTKRASEELIRVAEEVINFLAGLEARIFGKKQD
jgi:HEPN domain-containing protein